MKLKAEELRIGNFVVEEVLGNVPVVGIEENSIWVGVKNMDITRMVTDQKYHISLIEIKPILLTRDLLVDCGFSPRRKDGCFLKIPNTNLTFYYNEGVISIEDNDWLEEKLQNINHLHQLQNLYFALTGEELTYTPTPLK